jgi:hypothetical protein
LVPDDLQVRNDAAMTDDCQSGLYSLNDSYWWRPVSPVLFCPRGPRTRFYQRQVIIVMKPSDSSSDAISTFIGRILVPQSQKSASDEFGFAITLQRIFTSPQSSIPMGRKLRHYVCLTALRAGITTGVVGRWPLTTSRRASDYHVLCRYRISTDGFLFVDG